MYPISPLIVIAALLALVPYLAAGFFPARFTAWVRGVPLPVQLLLPSLLCVPYLLVSVDRGVFSARWLALYAILPVAMAVVLSLSRGGLGNRLGCWPEFLILAVLGLAVDLRWFERAWPAHLSVFNKVLLLDAGIYAFVAIRQLDGVGFDLRLRVRDIAIGLREFVFFFPFALGLGLWLGFLHLHGFGSAIGAVALKFAGAWVFTFFFIAVPEELFFRGWVQNLLERQHRANQGACLPRRSCSGCRTSTSAQCTSTGATCCWRRSPASSTGARGAGIGGSAHRRSRTPPWIQFGLCGFASTVFAIGSCST